MTMTPEAAKTLEEAKATWCPMARYGGYNSAYNRGGDIADKANCIADKCALWVWVGTNSYGHPRPVRVGACGLIVSKT